MGLHQLPSHKQAMEIHGFSLGNDLQILGYLSHRYQCDALDAACVDQDEAVGNLFGTSQGRKANCKLLKDQLPKNPQKKGDLLNKKIQK